MKKKLIICALIFIAIFNSCTILKKGIKKPITVSLIDTVLPTGINSTAQMQKYLKNNTTQQFISAFLQNFKSEGNATKNVTFSFNNPEADFTLKVDSFYVIEYDETTTINDEKSPYNGSQMIINTIACDVKIKITEKNNPSKSIKDCYYVKYKSGKLKNNRTLDDLVMDKNKDRTVYRTKPLHDGAAMSLVDDVGHNIWVQITKRISKNLK